MKKVWSVAIRERPGEQQIELESDKISFLPDNSSERYVIADKRKTYNLMIYDVYNKNIIKNSYCGTLTANCGCTTGCGCFFVFIGEKEDARR